jgi:hypothetical protein
MGVAEAQKFVHILRSTFTALEVLHKYLSFLFKGLME